MKVKLGYLVLHDNHRPEELLENVVLAENGGFDSIGNSDHFHPWGHESAHGTLAWIWMAAAAERTSKAPIWTGVTAPGYRYHPGIIAQAFATLGRLYNERIYLGVGVGEYLNEDPLGYSWPSIPERVERFEECLKIIRSLWYENFVDFKGKYYELRKANIYTKPKTPVPLYISSQGPIVSNIAGKYGDGYIFSINAQNFEKGKKLFREKCEPALIRGAIEAGRDPESIDRLGTMFVSYDEDYDKALEGCVFLKGGLAMGGALTVDNISDPREIDSLGSNFTMEEMVKKYHYIISTNIDDHIKGIEEAVKLGFNHIGITSWSPNEKKFLEIYSKEVIPYFRDNYGE